MGSQFVNAAVRDTDAVSQQPDRLRSRECEQLVFTNGRCEPCCRLRKRLQVRLASRAVKNKTSVNTANKFLSSPLRYSKLKHLARMSTSLKRKNNLIWRVGSLVCCFVRTVRLVPFVEKVQVRIV